MGKTFFLKKEFRGKNSALFQARKGIPTINVNGPFFLMNKFVTDMKHFWWNVSHVLLYCGI